MYRQSCYFFIKIIPYGLGFCHHHYHPPYSHEHWACQGWARGGWWVLGCARFRYVWTCPLCCPPNPNHSCTQPHRMGTGVRVIWRLIWRHTVEKSQTNVPCPLTQPNPTPNLTNPLYMHPTAALAQNWHYQSASSSSIQAPPGWTFVKTNFSNIRVSLSILGWWK